MSCQTNEGGRSLFYCASRAHSISSFLPTRSVIAAGDDAYIWRFDYISDETLKEWENWKAN